MDKRPDKMAGLLLGTALGDSIGLPREGISRRRAKRIFGDGPIRHGLVFGRGMVSDDTEHACMTAQALLSQPSDVRAFARSLGWKLRFWFLGLPAGVGMGTARALIKLWLGFSPRSSGVRSAGNGPAMRVPVIGACLGHDSERLREYVSAATRVTHTDPRAEQGALAVATCAAMAMDMSGSEMPRRSVLEKLRQDVTDEELLSIIAGIESRSAEGVSVADYGDGLGQARGVSGFIYHTVPVAIYAWLHHGLDFRATVESVVRLGGDTDTTGAIAGALSGATVGLSGLPEDWMSGLTDWPRSKTWMMHLGEWLGVSFPGDRRDEHTGPVPLFWPAIPLRNVFFLVVVLLHGFRRLLPPY